MPLDSFNFSRVDGTSSRSHTPTHHSSLSMEQALNSAVHQLQPSRTTCRVKDMGREYLQQNETCQWIQFMTEDAPDFSDRRDRRTRLPATKKKVVAAALGDGTVDRKAVKPQNSLPEGWEAKQKESLPQSPQELDASQELTEVKPNAVSGAVTVKPASVEANPVPSLQPSETFELPQKQTVEPVLDRKATPAILRGKCRRLKGCLAQNCALRDEGTVGSLIWQRDEAGQTNERDPSPHGMTKKLRNIKEEESVSPRLDRDESYDWSEDASLLLN